MAKAKFDRATFFSDVHDICRLIPKGRVTSYGAIAAFLGTKRSARMVGWAMHDAVSAHGVPAHRVVNSKGLLTGKHHFKGKSMADRLIAEGVEVKADKVQNFKTVFWDPVQELTFDD